MRRGALAITKQESNKFVRKARRASGGGSSLHCNAEAFEAHFYYWQRHPASKGYGTDNEQLTAELRLLFVLPYLAGDLL